MSMFGGSSLLQTLSLSYYGRGLEQYRTVYDKTMEAIKPHIIATVTTDFNGKGQFEPVKCPLRVAWIPAFKKAMLILFFFEEDIFVKIQQA